MKAGSAALEKLCERAEAVKVQAKFERDEFERIIEAHGRPVACDCSCWVASMRGEGADAAGGG